MPDLTADVRLADLLITEVSGVDHPAHLAEGWLVLKSRQPNEGGPVPEINRDALAPEVLAHIEAVEAERDEAVAKAASATPPTPATTEPAGDDLTTLLKSLGEDHPIVKALQSAETRALAAETIAREEQDRRVTAEFVATAKSLDSLSVNPEEFGGVLKALTEKAPEEAVAVLDVLKAANDAVASSKAFEEIGVLSPTPASGSARDRLEKSAKQIAESEGCDIGEAFTKAVALDPDAYQDYLAETRAGGA